MCQNFDVCRQIPKDTLYFGSLINESISWLYHNFCQDFLCYFYTRLSESPFKQFLIACDKINPQS